MPQFNFTWLYIIAGAVLLFIYLNGGEGGSMVKEADYSELKSYIEKGYVSEITVYDNDEVEAFVYPDSAKYIFTERKGRVMERPTIVSQIGSKEKFEEFIDAQEANGKYSGTVKYDSKPDYWGGLFWNVFPLIAFVGIWIFIMRRMSGGGGAQGGVFNVGKSKAKLFEKDDKNRVTFKDVAGQEGAKQEVQEIVDFLRSPQRYTDLGGKIPKGALLVGPPGTGKTLLAKAVAGEAEVPFFSLSGSDFVEMFVGVGASRVRDLFEQAKQKAPCIVFIDEIDAIGRARGKNAGFSGNDERENTLNQMLTEMDGFQTNAGVIVLAATNRADILDKALMRAGRFDRQIEVGLPDVKEREDIFNVHLRHIKLDGNIDRAFLAKQTPGFSGADIANVCNEAALIAARNNKKCVERDDFMAAIDRIVGGLEKRNKSMSLAERRATAIHEAGHATVMWRLKECDPVLKVTVIPRGNSLGATWSVPDEERVHVTDAVLQDKLAGLLGGRIAEEVNYGTLGAGALSDLERATKMTYAMVAFYGMSKKVGPISYYDAAGTRDTFTKPYSEQTAIEIDNEVRRILEEAYNRARQIIEENNDKIQQMADLLLEKETIYAEDIEPILGKSAQTIEKEQENEVAAPTQQGVTVAD